MIRVERAPKCYYPKRWVVIGDDPRRYSADVTFVKGAKDARRLARLLRSYEGHAIPQTLSKIQCQECREPYAIACQLYIHDPDHDTGDYYQVDYLCATHAQKAGYCPGCGAFIAGIGGLGVYCDTCEPEFEDESIDGAEEWDDYHDDTCDCDECCGDAVEFEEGP